MIVPRNEELWMSDDLRELKIIRNKAEVEMVRARVAYDNFFLRHPHSSTNRTLGGKAEDTHSAYYAAVAKVKELEEALQNGK
mgnify:FL=1